MGCGIALAEIPGLWRPEVPRTEEDFYTMVKEAVRTKADRTLTMLGSIHGAAKIRTLAFKAAEELKTKE